MHHLKPLFFVVLVLFAACTKQEKPFDYVDPFIGTDFHGHTYPGATTPFGAVQLSPDTRINNWDACSGYHYSDSTMLGFSHLHLSGTGAADLGDILFHPTTKPVNFDGERYIFDPLPFSHDDEIAKPGYYSVKFKDQGIKAELTATPRTGIHRYTFPASETSKIIIDLHHSVADETVHHAEFNVVSETEITGARISSGWTPNQHVYFVARFSKPFSDVKFLTDGKIIENSASASGTNVHGVFNFTTLANEQIEVNVGISVVSIENARLNLDAEAPEFDFDGLKKKAFQLWNNALDVAYVDGATTDQKKTFYTALYHTLVVPNLVSDVNGEYRGHDMTIKKMPEGKHMYSTLSIWDTFRTWHPLMTLIDDKLVNSIIHSMLSMYDDTGELPIWPLVSGETGTMIGYHSVSVIADAFRKGIADFDVEHAFEAMKVSSNSHRKGGKYYVENGFIPAEKHKESVSCLLEYAYDDWCIAMMAKELGREEDYETYSNRAYSWINVFDGNTRFFRGKRSDGNWVDPFNPFLVSRDYTEANAWQYRFFVPHDVSGLVQMFGGKEQFLEDFEGLFDESTEVISEIPDVTGLIGQYAHGNEPSHHMAYIYSFLGQPWKTQKLVRRVLDEMYSAQPDGISGNEDCGQMSAWYIMSSMGFYPVTPGSNEYVFTTPLFEKSTLKLYNGKTLKVNANNPAKNLYINKVTFNGKEITANFITHQELMQGGTLTFELTDKPDMQRGTKSEDAPYSMTTKNLVSVPFIKQDVNLFEGSLMVEFGTATKSAEIYYTLDGSEPTKDSQLYVDPIEVNESKTLKARAFKEGFEPSRIFSVDAVKAVYRNADRASASKQGTAYKYYHNKFASVYEMAATPVIASGVLEEPTIDIATREDDFGFEFSGLLYIEEDGIYDFYTESDDGSMLHIGKNVVVSNDGSHGAIRSTGRIALKKGYHEYTLLYFEDYAGQKLDWGWKKFNEADFRKIDKSILFLK
jgi:predicted alpha-1,2-mannosidase